MRNFVVHFEPPQGIDLAAFNVEVQAALKNLDGFDDASTRPVRTQGAAEVIAMITMGTKIVASSAAFLGAVSELVSAWRKLRALFPSLKAPSVEVGLNKVPVDQISEKHAEVVVST